MTTNQKRLQFITEELLLFVATITALLCLERFQAIEFSVEKFAGTEYSPAISLNGYMVILLAVFSVTHALILSSRIFQPNPWTRWQLLRRVAPLAIVLTCTIVVFVCLHSGLATIVWRHYS